MYIPDTEGKKSFVAIVVDLGEFKGVWDGCERGIETSEHQYEGFIPEWDEKELNFDERY